MQTTLLQEHLQTVVYLLDLLVLLTAIPVLTVNAKGRITATTVAITAMTVTGDSGSNESINLSSEVLSVSGGSNVTTTMGTNEVSVALDSELKTLPQLVLLQLVLHSPHLILVEL